MRSLASVRLSRKSEPSLRGAKYRHGAGRAPRQIPRCRSSPLRLAPFSNGCTRETMPSWTK